MVVRDGDWAASEMSRSGWSGILTTLVIRAAQAGLLCAPGPALEMGVGHDEPVSGALWSGARLWFHPLLGFTRSVFPNHFVFGHSFLHP